MRLGESTTEFDDELKLTGVRVVQRAQGTP
jgi:hypothetical protein